MEAKTGKFFESVGAFLDGGGDQIPWCDRDVIAGCEKEVADAANGGSEEHKSECIMRLSWALVHSRQAEDIQRGIAMLEASLASSSSPLQKREKLYLLAVGYYRSGEYGKSRQLVLKLVVKASKIRLSLVIVPDFRQVLTLKKTVEDRIAKDGVTGKGITASAVVGLIAGGIAGGIAAALARKK
ncbi:mitochondrial fission 1 protein A-like isoform X1 [Vitis riparia]|uniref:mitochondrial fission 1 protein A-like isoform X1 n=1 Tax=Vitis riparia TaxID=96939 RepID=UPI00155AC595|nr:mitochondrial fission 1 protein A-like isoform X1 [Vitis riparia]